MAVRLSWKSLTFCGIFMFSIYTTLRIRTEQMVQKYVKLALLHADLEAIHNNNSGLIHNHHSNVNSYTACNKFDNIYYVKIHKTGSTTFQNIIYRLGLKRQAFFALFDCPYGMTYPHPPKSEYLYPDPTASSFRSYSMVTDHTMFDPRVFQSYMPGRTFIITLLRHPLHQLSSSMAFWGLPAKFNIPGDDPVRMYLLNPGLYEETRMSFGCFPPKNISQTRNPQAHHLGFTDQSNANLTDISRFVQTVDLRLDLVLILERFPESLLLLKRLLCLHTKDILHLQMFSTKFFRRKTYAVGEQDELETLHRRWSAADYALYDHFLNKLDLLISKQYPDFYEELADFQNLQTQVKDFCQESCHKFEVLASGTRQQAIPVLSEEINIPASRWNTDFTVSRGDCLLMMLVTLLYDEALKVRQWPTSCDQRYSKPKADKYYCNKSDLVMDMFPWTKLVSTPYMRSKDCLKNM